MNKSAFQNKITTCNRCGMPETSRFIDYDEFDICKACRSSEQKMHFDWNLREKKLIEIFEHFKEKSKNNYDCIVPISGGKDSAFQLFLLTKVYKLKPLAVTFSHNWYTDTGRENLKNMVERLNVDLIEFTPNRSLINSLAKDSLDKIGDACWHCHTGVDSFPLQAAVRFKIPLLVYGESIADFSGKATYLDNPDYTLDYFLKYSSIVTPDQMINKNVSKKDLTLFQLPTEDDLKEVGVVRIHLGDFIFWDAERQTEFVRDFLGWKEDHVEGTFKKYKSVECIMPGVHDYTKYLKRGFGRGTDFAVQDVRSGLLNKLDARKLSEEYDSSEPEILKYYLDITDTTKDEFYKKIMSHRENKANLLPTPEQMTTKKNHSINNSVKKYNNELESAKYWHNKIENIQFQRIWPNLYKNNLLKCETIIQYNKISNSHSLPIYKQIEFLNKKELSVYEITKSAVEHIEKNEINLKAWSYIDFDKALDQAKYIDQDKTKYDKQKLNGTIVGVKDIFNTADMPTSMGSLSTQNYNPGNDARVVHNLRKNLNVILGKTSTAEFGVHSPPPTRNPHNKNFLPGTSSSGSAAAVSSRMVPMSLGSQTAGSTIRPSSYCGIFGMKPTFGTIPRTGVLKTSDTLDHITLMTNNIKDLKLSFNTLRVNGINYPLVNKYLDNQDNLEIDLKKIKVAFVKTHTWEDADLLIKDSILNKINKLSNSGLNVEEINLPETFSNSHNVHEIIYSKSLSYYFKDQFKNKRELLKKKTVDMIEIGNSITIEDYYRNIDIQNKMILELEKILSNYDFIISHSTASTAPKDETVIESNDPCLIWSLSHVPAVNIPEFMSKNSMPFGMQIVAKRYYDIKLINFLIKLSENELIKNFSPLPKDILF